MILEILHAAFPKVYFKAHDSATHPTQEFVWDRPECGLQYGAVNAIDTYQNIVNRISQIVGQEFFDSDGYLSAVRMINERQLRERVRHRNETQPSATISREAFIDVGRLTVRSTRTTDYEGRNQHFLIGRDMRVTCDGNEADWMLLERVTIDIQPDEPVKVTMVGAATPRIRTAFEEPDGPRVSPEREARIIADVEFDDDNQLTEEDIRQIAENAAALL